MEINSLSFTLFFISIMLIVLSFLAVLYAAYKGRKIMNHLNHMLDAAARGTFSEAAFDESLLSSVEARMAGYLSASQVSARNLTEEKDKIKTLIADISHQTKTPIANILLYTQLLKEQELPEESRLCVEALSVQSQKLAFLTDSLIKISRLETGVFALHPKKQPVSSLFDQIFRQASPKAEAGHIRFTAEDTDASACFDLKWTVEALYNIVDNGLKYTQEGGEVRLCARQHELFVRIDVTDSGMGIADEEQALIFGRFYRSASACDAEGVGIGLYLTRQIIAGQGGYIKVHSKPNEGSTFSVYLPSGR